MQLEAVVFDWDLTLWNSWDVHLDLMERTADALGYPRPATADLGKEYSRPFFEHLTWFFPGDQEKVVVTYMDLYQAAVWQENRLYSGVLELLRQLKSDGYRTGILSDKRQVFGGPELEFSGLGSLVDQALFFSDGMAPKPDPSGLQELMRLFGAAPGRCIFVGDSYRDIECARRAGVRSGAALWASVEPERVLALEPEFRWKRVEDVSLALKLGRD
ncbi:MAG TPA: HAD family hydrolase [Dehalococcoidia bacterium]|jgi:HAD superfamily hydrolase (TIGR01509 family)|nr:HAD family hydrolase [Dehalococcoidia bacterium]